MYFNTGAITQGCLCIRLGANSHHILSGILHATCSALLGDHIWYKIWRDAGCPASGVLFEIKKRTKSRYKYAARRTLRQQNRLHSERMAHALINNHGHDFLVWNKEDQQQANLCSLQLTVLASLFESVFIIGNKNAHDTLSTHLSQATMSDHDLCDVVIIPDVIR